MSNQILMPALSPTMTSGKIAKWLVTTGDQVCEGDLIAEVETDKATMEIEATGSGFITIILQGSDADDVAVDAIIADLSEEAVAVSSVPTPTACAPVVESKPASAPEKKAETTVAQDMPEVKVKASPLAKRLGHLLNIDVNKLQGSGVGGKVVKIDVVQAAGEVSEKPAPTALTSTVMGTPAATISNDFLKLLPAYENLPNSSMRKVIAGRLTSSARDIPHFNLLVDVEIDKLLSFRKDLNTRDGADYKISVNDLLIKACSVALKRVPDCNVSYTDDAILRFERSDISMAVSIEGGLITPIIKDAGSKGLAQISKESKDLAGRARDGKLMPEEFQGGTFTISNLGMMGIKSFNSIINPPQGAILSVGVGEQRAVVKDGALAIATVMSLNLAVDHRCIDGSTGAAFIKELKGLIEDPIALML